MSLLLAPILWVLAFVLLLGLLALWALRRQFLRVRAQALASLRGRHPDLTVVGETPEGAIVRLAGVEVRLDLASFFRRSGGRADPAALDRLVDEIRAALPPPQPPPLQRVRGHLLPLIKPAAFVALYRRYPPALQLTAQPFAEALAVIYAIEGFHQITYVTDGMLRTWELSAEELHRLALANLRRRTVHLLEELGGPRTIYESLDGFEATRILVPDLVTPLDLEPAVAAIPHEHLLLIAGRDGAARLAGEAAAAFARARFPLTPAVFRLGEASLVPDVLS